MEKVKLFIKYELLGIAVSAVAGFVIVCILL